MPLLKYKGLKLTLRVFLAGHTVPMVTYSVIKMITTCLPMIRQVCDTMIVESIDNECCYGDKLCHDNDTNDTNDWAFLDTMIAASIYKEW